MKRNTFVLFCSARTGSYSLVSRLDSARDILCHGEIFKPNRLEVEEFYKSKMKINSIKERDEKPLTYINALRILNPHCHFGFKLFNSHLSRLKKIGEYLMHPDTKRIVLVRDYQEVYCSLMRAKASGIWVRKITSPKKNECTAIHMDTETPVAFFDEESFSSFSHHYSHFIAKAHDLKAMKNTFVIHYNQINNEHVINALFDFLGSKTSFADTASLYMKQAASVRDNIANWDIFQEYIETIDVSGFVLPNPTISF